MASAQWSLVAFTILVQAAVGMTLVTAAMVAGGVPLGHSFRRVLGAKLALMTVALLASFLHLGSMTRAVHAVSHWRNSWLSREVLLAAIFFGLLVATLVFAARGRRRERTFGILLAVTVLIGVALVTVMARVYMVPTVPAWRGPATPIAFAVTTVLLGATAMLVMVSRDGADGLGDARLSKVAGWLIGAVVVGLAVKLGAALLAGAPIVADHAAFPAAAPGGVWRVVVWIAVALGVAALAAWLAAWRKGRPSRAAALVALLAFFAAELVERALFYASYFRLGV